MQLLIIALLDIPVTMITKTLIVFFDLLCGVEKNMSKRVHIRCEVVTKLSPRSSEQKIKFNSSKNFHTPFPPVP